MRGQRPTACIIWAYCIIFYRNIYGLVSIFDPNNSVRINDTGQHHITKPSRQRLEIAPPTVSCITSFYIFSIKWLIFPFFLFELLLDFFFGSQNGAKIFSQAPLFRRRRFGRTTHVKP